jgi:hypothetical protein
MRVGFLPDASIFEVLDLAPEWFPRRCWEMGFTHAHGWV